MSYDPNNIFAKILRGEIPCHKVYEDADAIVFMDVMPQSPGHALVMPKAASRNLFDADPAVLAKIAPLVQKVAVAAKAAFNADGISVIQYNEPAGGQIGVSPALSRHPTLRGIGVETALRKNGRRSRACGQCREAEGGAR